MSYQEDLLSRYIKTDETSWEDVFKRVAKFLADNDPEYQSFFNLMQRNEFYPNTPALLNAGTNFPMCSACFSFAIQDNMEHILQTFKEMAKTQYLGGGTGIGLDNLRHFGAPIQSGARGHAMGVVNTIRGFDGYFKAILHGGLRRSASMGVINDDHPEIFEFIKCKDKEGDITTFNISVGISDRFMQAVENDEEWDLIDRKTKKVYKTIEARELWNAICYQAHKNGEPGLLFLDTLNKFHPLPETIMNTNPCGEAVLSEHEACVLGSLNLPEFILYDDNKKVAGFNWDRLEKTVNDAVKMLNKIIDKQIYPLKKIEKKVKKNRKIGLGIMGFATICVLLEIKYGSKECLKFIEQLMGFIRKSAYAESKRLVKKYGNINKLNRANTLLLSIAPTGSISRIADTRTLYGTSFGIEPYYEREYISHVMGHSYSQQIKILEYQLINEKVLVFANELTYQAHIRVQARFQNFVDHSVSKTINFPLNATVDDIANAFLMAWKYDCKGITVYRTGSRNQEVLEQKKKEGCTTGVCEL